MRVLAILAVAALNGLVAGAEVKPGDIATRNAAIGSGDVAAQLAAARHLAHAAINDPSNPDAVLLAYEAAWTLCRLGECAAAIAPARFAASEGLAGGTPRILSAYAAWNAEPGRSERAALRSALEAEAGLAPTMISLRAFRELYFADNAEGRFVESARTADLAARHFAGAEGGLPEFESEARLVAAVAEFLDRPKLPAMKNMAALSAEFYEPYASAGDEGPAWMKDRYWQSQAWLYAMQAYLRSRSQPSLSEADWKALQQAAVAGSSASQPGRTPDQRRACSGELVQKPSLTYPGAAKRAGKTGSVIIGFDLVDGSLTNFEVLASVPLDGFRVRALEAVSQWTWRFTEPPGPHFKTSHENVVVPLTFWLG